MLVFLTLNFEQIYFVPEPHLIYWQNRPLLTGVTEQINFERKKINKKLWTPMYLIVYGISTIYKIFCNSVCIYHWQHMISLHFKASSRQQHWFHRWGRSVSTCQSGLSWSGFQPTGRGHAPRQHFQLHAEFSNTVSKPTLPKYSFYCKLQLSDSFEFSLRLKVWLKWNLTIS